LLCLWHKTLKLPSHISLVFIPTPIRVRIWCGASTVLAKEGNEETEDSSYDGSEQMFEYNPTGNIGNIFVDENDDDGEEPLFP
jgi:hypothetical protein